MGKVSNGVYLCVHLCVCLFFHTISQESTQLGLPNFSEKRSTKSSRNPFISESKGHDAQKQSLCLGFQTERNTDACCMRKRRWVFPPQCRDRRGLFRAWSSAQSARQRQNIDSMCHGATQSACWLFLVFVAVTTPYEKRIEEETASSA